MWQTDGISVCVAIKTQEVPQVVSDGRGGAIVIWEDYRSGSNYDIYAQRVCDRHGINLPLVAKNY